MSKIGGGRLMAKVACGGIKQQRRGFKRKVTLTPLGQEVVRCRFRLRTGSAGLLEDKKRCKKRCKLAEEGRCILCYAGVAEDIKHFLVTHHHHHIFHSVDK